MSKLFSVYMFELRAMLRRRGFIFMTGALPLVGLTVIVILRIVSAVNADEPPTIRGFVDHWGKLPTERLDDLRLMPYPDENAAQAALLREEIDAFFVIPANYVETGNVQQFATSESGVFGDTSTGAALRSILVRALVEDNVAPDIAERIQFPISVDRVRLTRTGQTTPAARAALSRFLVPYIFSIMLMTSIFFSSGILVQSVSEEKQSRTIEVLLSSVSPITLMGGKILGLGTAGLVQIVVWLISARILVSFAEAVSPILDSLTIEPGMILLGIVFFLLGYLFFGTVLAGIGAMVTSPQEGGQLAGFVSMSAAVPFFLIAMIIDQPGGALARTLTFIPFTSPLTVMLRMSATTLPWLDFLIASLILAASTVVALFLSARIFRAYLLLYGRRPGVRELLRTLRTAD